MSKQDLQEATGPKPEESPSLSDLIHRWRTAVRVWRDIDDDIDWGKDGSEEWQAKESHYWAGHAQLMKASRLLASRLAISGFSPALMTTVLEVHESNSRTWDESDGGKARQLAAIAATERFLRSIEQSSHRQESPSTPPTGTPSPTHDVDRGSSGSRQTSLPPPRGAPKQDGHATSKPKNSSLAILEVLEQLPSWVDFDPDPHKWTDGQITERMPVWRILPRHWKQGPLPSPKEKLWLVICNGTLAAR